MTLLFTTYICENVLCDSKPRKTLPYHLFWSRYAGEPEQLGRFATDPEERFEIAECVIAYNLDPVSILKPEVLVVKNKTWANFGQRFSFNAGHVIELRGRAEHPAEQVTKDFNMKYMMCLVRKS